MRSTQQTATVDGQTFKRDHYTGQPTFTERRRGFNTDSANAWSPWTLEIATKEFNDELEATGETTGIQVKVWPTQEVIKVEGAHRMGLEDADALAKALKAAATLLDEIKNERRCQSHGTLCTDEMGPDCEGCFNEMMAELDAADRRAGRQTQPA